MDCVPISRRCEFVRSEVREVDFLRHFQSVWHLNFQSELQRKSCRESHPIQKCVDIAHKSQWAPKTCFAVKYDVRQQATFDIHGKHGRLSEDMAAANMPFQCGRQSVAMEASVPHRRCLFHASTVFFCRKRNSRLQHSASASPWRLQVARARLQARCLRPEGSHRTAWRRGVIYDVRCPHVSHAWSRVRQTASASRRRAQCRRR